MIQDKRVLAVVPARGGSKGIPRKNLRTVGGTPLVVLAGKAAAMCRLIDRAVVSTDDEEIARVCEASGLAAPFRRPADLSGDQISDWQVLDNALSEMEQVDGVAYDIIVMLQPTSPGRTESHVTQTIQKLVDGRFDAVWTVSETDSKAHPLKQLTIADNGMLDYYQEEGANIVARQQLTPVYHRNGLAYAFTRECLKQQRTIKGLRTGALFTPGNFPNIDTELDLEWTEFLFARQGVSAAQSDQ